MHNDPIIYKPLSAGWHEDDIDPSIVNSLPDLIGRIQGDKVDMESVRSDTGPLVSVSVPFDGAAMGVATVGVFQSSGVGDDAGIVMRITVDNCGSAFQPHAVLIPTGVDLHIAGATESTATLEAIQQAATQALHKLQHRTQVQATAPTTPQWLQILMDTRPTSVKRPPKRRPKLGKH